MYIQIYTQVKQLLNADCADQKNKDYKKQACEAAAKKITYEDVSKIFLESLLKYF